jgi:hypothetical protein
MNNFEDIQSLWNQQPTGSVPSLEEISRLAKKNKSRMVRTNAIGIATLGFTLVFIASFLFWAEFRFYTTKLGIVVMMVAIIGSIVMNSQQLRLILNTADDTKDNAAYLAQLLLYRKKQRFFQTRWMGIYFILLSVGLILYLYEFYARDKTIGLVAFGSTAIWIGFAWFYIRPRAIRKQEKRLNEFISQIEGVSKQLSE